MSSLMQITFLVIIQFVVSFQNPVDEAIGLDNANNIQQSTWFGTPALDLILESDRYVMIVLAEKIKEAQLPVQLRPAARQIFNEAENQLKKCETEYVTLHLEIWTYKLCVAEVLKNALLLIETINEHVHDRSKAQAKDEINLPITISTL